MFSSMKSRRFAAAWWLLPLALIALPLCAQDKYPSRPIDFIVPWGPGGGSDQTARQIGQLLEAGL